MTAPAERQYILRERLVAEIEELLKDRNPAISERIPRALRSRPAPAAPNIESLKKAIIEVLDTGFESSEWDIALVLDRIDAWQKGELRQQEHP